MKGDIKNVAGKVQQKIGELTGNKTQQAKGAAKQVEGKVQKNRVNVERRLDGGPPMAGSLREQRWA